jgi:hypothetical protein
MDEHAHRPNGRLDQQEGIDAKAALSLGTEAM